MQPRVLVATIATPFVIACALAACSSTSSDATPAPPPQEGETADAAGNDAASRADTARGAQGERDADRAPADAGHAGPTVDGGDAAARPSDGDAQADASGACEYGGAPGDCVTVAACAAMADHTSFAGHCPGPTDVQCCILTPSTADNPPTPAGYMLMQQSQVTSAMTSWAVMILDDPTTYPMFSTTTMMFGTLDVLARVEWHPPDFQNSVVHRGVTLYIPGA